MLTLRGFVRNLINEGRKNILINWEKFPAVENLRPGFVRRAMAAEKISAVRVIAEAGTEFDGRLHHHEHEQLLVMISGEMHLRVGTEDIIAHTGDMVFFPPHLNHGATGVGPEGAEYYEIFSPSRVDQLPGWIGSSIMQYD
jgi:quercetin dioxygenase-like cupin family protein